MANILILSSDFYPLMGGVATDSFNFYKLIKDKHNVEVHVFGVKAQCDGIHYHAVSKINYLSVLKNIFKKEYDIIILRTIFPLAWMVNILKPNAKKVLFIYGQEIISRNYLKPRPTVNSVLNNADLIISISHYTSSLIKQDSIVFPPLLDMDDYEPQIRKRSKDIFTIGSIGRIEKHKNIMAILKKLTKIEALLKRDNFRLHYIIAGRGDELKLCRQFVADSHIEHMVEFRDCPDNQSRSRFYNDIDLLVMPSVSDKNHIEGFGIVVQEAGLFHKPAIGYASGGLNESLEFSTIMADEGDEQMLINHIIKLCINREIYDREADAAYNRAMKYVINSQRLAEINNILGIGSGGRI